MVRPGIYWLLQGEEETASPFAHDIFPKLALPDVSYWLEENGYFNAIKGQRFLVNNPSPELNHLVARLMDLGRESGFGSYIESRYMNKAFGEHKCPYINHVVKGQPYLAIGPNDDESNIHAPNESIPLATIGLSYNQFLHVISGHN